MHKHILKKKKVNKNKQQTRNCTKSAPKPGNIEAV
jgi:hypothetical protein